MKKLLNKFLVKIANISKKGIIIYCITTTVLFLIAAGMFLTGVIFLPPNKETIPAAIPLTITGGIILVILLFSVLLMTLASNYAKNRANSTDKGQEFDKTK